MKAAKRAFTAAALSLGLAASAMAQSSVIELERTASGYFVAPVFIGTDGPYPFAPDTGASHTAIAQSLAEAHGFISTQDRLDAVQTLTAEVQAERHGLVDLRLGPVPLGEIDMVVTPTPPDLELELFGLLGSNAFTGHVIKLDYPQARLTVNAQQPRHADARIDPVRQVLVGAAQARRIEDDIAVLIDTGSPITLVNHALARRLNQRTPVSVVNVGNMTRIPNPVETEDRVILSQFRMGGVCLRRIAVSEADLDVFRAMGWDNRPAMIVGLDLLQSTALTIDFETGRAQIDPGPETWRCPGDRRAQLSH
ncbi:aspartyl protease family protein [Oceanicaulis alexandrii]|uniref:aspartyl protease family protein n=1 Tax=Oceanicaulis alexandrii TaxID=153233 RepID=UPI0023542C1D|nr:aspartyl protease family protein [Oceanicaulis alexandrii]